MAKDHLTFFTSLAVVFLFTMLICTQTHGETNTVSSTVSSNTVDKAPPSAISPSISIVNSDICKSGYAGSVTTQILGVSTGITVSDENCVRIKLSRQLMTLNLKVPAVAILAQDPQVFDALWMSGVYPPIEGKIGEEAKEIWLANTHLAPAGSTVLVSKKPPQTTTTPEQDVLFFKTLFLITTGLLLF
tara:strand:+ start:3696 stop:4259 length:564 start_codon:yes stop_codon:yes gene_type:complete